MAIIYSVHYIKGSELTTAQQRENAALAAYKLGHSVNEITGLMPTIDGVGGITADAWYVLTIDTDARGSADTGATITRLSARSDSDTTIDRIWLVRGAAGRIDDDLNAQDGKDEYLIASSFSEEVEGTTHTATVITITDTGENVFRFRGDVKIGAYDLDGTTLSIAFGANTHEALVIQNATTAKFKIGSGSGARELTLRQFLHIINKQTGEKSSGTNNDAYFVGGDITAAPTGLPYVPNSSPITGLFFFLDLPDEADEMQFNAYNSSIIGTHTAHTTELPSTVTNLKWYRTTYNPLNDSLKVVLSENAEGDGQGTDGADDVWIFGTLINQTTTTSGGGGVDVYRITDDFSVAAAMNDSTGSETDVTINDTGMNIYRFRDGVKIKSATLESGVLKVKFDMSDHVGLTINNAAAGSFRFGNTNTLAFTAEEFVTFIGRQTTPNPYTVVDNLTQTTVDAVFSTIAFTEGDNPNKSVSIRHFRTPPPSVSGDASGTLTAARKSGSGVTLTDLTHNGADAVYGTFTFTPDAQKTPESRGGAWTYTLNATDRDTLRLRSQTANEVITFTATDSNDEPWTYDLSISIEVTSGPARNLVVADQYSGQATAIINGVLFTVNERVIGGNNIVIQFTATAPSNMISELGGDYTISLAADQVVTPKFLKDFWDTYGSSSDATTRTNRITATIVDPDIPDATRDQIAGRYIFRGGADGVTDAIADQSDDKEVALNWTVSAISANNALDASGRLAILDPDDGASGSTARVVSGGRYGTFTIPETGTGAFTLPGSDPAVTTQNGIFDWTYTLDLTDPDTRALAGGGDDKSTAKTHYDIITLSVTDTNGGISFHDIPIEVDVTGIQLSFTIGTGGSATTHTESGASTAATASLTENTAYDAEAILGVSGGAVTPTIDDASAALGFEYDAAMNEITFTGTLDYESLTDADTNTGGLQHGIILTAIGGGGTATHNVLVTIANADDAPVIDSDNITTHSDVSEAQASDIPTDVTPPNNVDATALYFAIDENETPSGALFTIPAADEDTGDTIAYTLTATDASGADVLSRFEIDEDSGAVSLKSGAVLDHEASAYVLFEVTATSDSILAGAGNEKTATQQVILIINDVHEPDPMTPDNMPPMPIIDQTIAFNRGDAFVFTRRQLDANDPDTTDADMLIYTLTGLTVASGATASMQTYDSANDRWTALVAGTSGSDTFTQEDVDNGHVRLMADGDGTLSLRVSDGATTVPAVGTDATEITFKVRVMEAITAKEIGGAGDNGVLDLSDDDADESKSVTTGIGHTTIRLGAGDDEVDGGLGDDTIDLTQGGEDVVIYRYATDKDDNIIPWGGGDSITGFNPRDDRLLVSDIGGGDSGDAGVAAFLNGLGEDFVATVSTDYTGGSNGDRTDIEDYDVTGVEIHFAQAVLLPGGVLGGSVLSIAFDDPIEWTGNDGFNSEWLNGAAADGTNAAAPFNTDELLFNNNADGKAALTRILGLRGPGVDAPVEPARSVAVGDGGNNTIDLTDGGGAAQAGEWVIDGGGGDDMITLAEVTPPPPDGGKRGYLSPRHC